MIRVRGKQREHSGCRVCRVAYRDVQLICSYHFQRWISILPPILVPDHSDVYSVGRLFDVLDAGDDTRCRQEQDHNDENGNDRPRKFHLDASINLRGLTPVIRTPPPEFHDRVGK